MIKMLLRSLLVFIFLLVGLITFLLTPMGLRFSVDTASHFLPGKLSVKKISGVIIGPLTVNELHYQDHDQTIDIAKLTMRWSPIDLFNKELHINTLQVQGLHFITKNNNLPKKWTLDSLQQAANTLIASLKKRALPFHAVINHADFQDIQIINPTSLNTIQIQQLQLHLALTAKKWDAQVSAIVQKPIPFDVHFQLLGKPTDYAMHFALNGKHVHWSLIGNGNDTTLTLHSPDKLLLDGTLNTQFYVYWDKSLKWTGQLTAKNINLSLLNPSSIKSLSLAIKSNGDVADSITMQNDVHVSIPTGEAHITLNRGKTWHVRWHAKLHSLPDWLTKISESAESRGKIEGDLNNPHFTMSLKGQINQNNKTSLATINLDGDFLHHVLSAQFIFPKQKINLKLDGRLQDQGQNQKIWQGNLQQLSYALDNSITWQLAKPVRLSASDNAWNLAPLCLQSRVAGNVCLQGQFLDKKIHGNVQIHIPHFDWFHALFHRITIPSGQLDGNFKIDGTLEQPIITGMMNLKNGSIVLPHFNLTLNNISAAITGSKSVLTFIAKAYSQKAPINLKGQIDLSKMDILHPKFLANAELTTTKTPIIDTEEYKIAVTSDLKASIEDSDIFVTGNIAIPTAMITPADFQPTVTLPEHDIVYIGAIAPPPNAFWKIHTNVLLTVGKDVHIKAGGADAQLGGALRVTQNPNHEMFGLGDITVRKGIFSVYGQTLTITPNSYISFENSLLNNPALNVKATKMINNVSNMGISNFGQNKLMVGVAIDGDVKTPKISFFSNRSSLSQADILSYLLLGYANERNTPGNTDFLLRALSAAKISSQGLLGQQNIASEIQTGLGLSELGIESDTTVDALGNPLSQHSAFVVGKSLTRRFYVRLNIGLLTPVNVYQVGYVLNHNWSVQGDSSTLGNGADVLYTFSRQ